MAVGHLDERDPGTREWLCRAVRLGSRSAPETRCDLQRSDAKWFVSDAAWSFTGWARRTKNLAWSSARFLAEALADYWGWREEGRKRPPHPFGLHAPQLDRYLAQRCRGLIALKGVRALSTLQAFHYFTEYLVARAYFGADEAERLQAAGERLFGLVRNMTDPGDCACHLYPTYAALVAGPTREARSATLL